MKKKWLKFFSITMLVIFTSNFFVGCAGSGGSGSSASAPTTEAANDNKTETPKADVTQSEEAAPEVIKIGFLTPLTGASAALGQQVEWAANMIVDLVNEEHPESSMELAKGAGLPNLNGAKLQLVVADHKSDATTAVAEAKRLITEEHVVAITGEFTSALIKAVAVVTEQYEIPLLAAGSAVTLTDGSTPLHWFFRFGVNDATYIKDTFDFLTMLNETQNAEIKTVAFLSEDSEFGANIVIQELKYAEEGGFTVAENISYPASSTNLTAEVLKIKAADPDVLIMASFVSDALLFINTCKEQNYTPKLIVGQRGGFIQPDYLEAMGEGNNYICTTGSWSSDLNSAVTQELVKLYPEKYSNGVALSDGHVKDIACLLFVAMAINQAGTTDSAAVQSALRDLDFDINTLIIPWNDITMNEFGQNTSANGIVAQWIDGKYRTVYPADVASEKAVYPMPTWD
ncbi:branched-chain amino acid ABC transporter substrate-binding protein [Bacteroidia bacterium]|nr:branched-chain amino acid ABC transporter substrate-binding protein [Bacteroidia bacterium]